MGRVAERVSLDFVISTGDNFYLRGVMDDVDLNWRNMSHGSMEQMGGLMGLLWPTRLRINVAR